MEGNATDRGQLIKEQLQHGQVGECIFWDYMMHREDIKQVVDVRDDAFLEMLMLIF